MYQSNYFFDYLAAAFIRGLRYDPEVAYPRDEMLHLDTPLVELNACDMEEIVKTGIASGLRLHHFKRSADLPRVAKVLVILKGSEPANLLDIGSGRGTFLWPLLDAFPGLPVTAVDKEETHVAAIKAVSRGGVDRLKGFVEDATRLSFADGAFDVVTMLEVVEHVPEAMRALAEAVRVARRYVVISVPSREDEAPSHTHTFNTERLAEMLQLAGAARVSTERVQNHLIVIGRVSRLASVEVPA